MLKKGRERKNRGRMRGMDEVGSVGESWKKHGIGGNETGNEGKEEMDGEAVLWRKVQIFYFQLWDANKEFATDQSKSQHTIK